MTKEKDRPILFTKAQLKTDFGFTEKMISTLLGAPIEKTNPVFKCASPMKLWAKEEVDVVITSDEYKELKAKADKRRASAKKAVATKTEKTMDIIKKSSEKIHITEWDKDFLMEMTLKSKQEWYAYQYELRHLALKGCEVQNAYDADDATKERWMVNYIRHNLTTYDSDISELKNKVGKEAAYNYFRDIVFDKIAEAYPYLADECENQKNRCNRYWI